jgi:purine-binding chemotaxis protein CheW
MHHQAFLCFTVAERRLALPLSAVRHVAPVPLLHPPVAAPDFVEGFFDFQGAPVAAIRLDRLLDLGDAQLGLYTPLLILAGDAPALALHVARADGVVQAPAAAIQPIDDDATLNGCVAGRFSERGETVYLLEAGRLLLAAERDKLAAHRAMQQRRLEALNADADDAS